MPKISSAGIIEYTTWLKLQIGDIELTSALPSVIDKYPIEISHKYLKYILLVSKIFQVHKLYKRGEEDNIKGMAEMAWKTGGKTEKPEKRLERKISQVLRTNDFTVFVAIPVILQISMWT